MLGPELFFDLKKFEHRAVFSKDQPVWAALDHLNEYLSSLLEKRRPLSNFTGHVERTLVIYEGEVRDDFDIARSGPGRSLQILKNGKPAEGAAVIFPGVFLCDDRILIGPGTVVEPGAFLRGPAVIGKDCEIRQGAYIRGECLVGNGCVVGHTTEIKGSILLDGAKAAHFAYVGDSILGVDVNLGAGTKLANLKMIPGTISVTVDKKRCQTGRRKLGAILGDHTETGCNSVTSPGTFLGPNSIVYSAMAVPGGYYPERTIIMPSKGSLRIQ